MRHMNFDWRSWDIQKESRLLPSLGIPAWNRCHVKRFSNGVTPRRGVGVIELTTPDGIIHVGKFLFISTPKGIGVTTRPFWHTGVGADATPHIHSRVIIVSSQWRQVVIEIRHIHDKAKPHLFHVWHTFCRPCSLARFFQSWKQYGNKHCNNGGCRCGRGGLYECSY